MPSSLRSQISGLLDTPKKPKAPLTEITMEKPEASLDALRNMVETNHVRVRDLFKAWDEDKNGKVNKKEFRKALIALGIEANKEQMDLLFDQLDRDGNSCIDYNELHSALRGGMAQVADAKKVAAGEAKARQEAEAKRAKALSELSTQKQALSNAEEKLMQQQREAEEERLRAKEEMEGALEDERARAEEKLRVAEEQLRVEREKAEAEVRSAKETAETALAAAQAAAKEKQMESAEREQREQREQQLQEETQRLTAELDRVKSELEDTKHELQQAKQQVSSLELDVRFKDSEKEHLNEKVDLAHRERDEEVKARIEKDEELVKREEEVAELTNQIQALRDGLTRAERTIAKWEHKAEHWTESDAQRTRMLQEATEKTQLAEADTSKLSAEYAAATEQWNDERNALRNRLAAHEFELERARSQQALRDNLASAIMHSAVDDGQRSDSVHFWQSRKLKWKSSVTTDVSDGTPDQPVGGVAIKTATPDPFAELPPDNFAQLPWRRGAATSATKYQLPVAAQAPYSKHELSPAPTSAPPPPPPPPPPPTPFGGSYSAHLLMQTPGSVPPPPPPAGQHWASPVAQPSFVVTPNGLRSTTYAQARM